LRAPIIAALFLFLTAISPLRSADFELKDGDKVVTLGSALIEREQRYGYWETALTARWPERKFTFRNLGWSGDNVHGEARLAFDINKPEVGLQRMTDLTLAEKPTRVVICYGANESYDGRAGLGKFERGLEKLIDALAPTRAGIALSTPIPFERSGPGMDSADARNHTLDLYCSAMESVAKSRSLGFIDLFAAFGKGQTHAGPFTDNGVHLTAFGYWATRIEFERALGLAPIEPRLVEIAGTKRSAINASIQAVPGQKLRFDVTLDILPEPPRPLDGASLDFKRPIELTLKFSGLAPGNYALRIDCTEAARATAEQWAAGVPIGAGPDFDQADQLRQVIVDKNKLYFYRWRPQNETYLFGFRKHEQGKNAKEIAEFDPLIAKAESDINDLKKPKPHRYELTPVEK
jgi:hypothetical protein